MKMTLADEVLYTTINLHRLRNGETVGTGTGFFWTMPTGDGREITAIITNKHVVDDCDQIGGVFHERENDGPNGIFSRWALDVPSHCVRHPDPEVDLCAILFGPALNAAQQAGRPLFFKSLGIQNLPTEEDWESFDSIEDVIMVGCPRGISDEANNLPIVRRGITATPLSRRYAGRNEFMVDMACFPGSSGSPVYLMTTGHMDRKTGSYIFGSGRFFFLGVLYSGPLINNQGRVVLSQQPRVEVAAMMHLGQVIRSSEMLPLQAEILTTAEETNSPTNRP